MSQQQPGSETTRKPLNVMHVTFDMRIGGTEQVIRNLIEASDPRQLQMSIFCVEEPLGPWGVALREAGTPVFSCARRDGFDLRVLRALCRCLREQSTDVVHCHQYTPWVYGALAALGTQARVIFTEHGRFYPDRASPKRRFINPLLARITDHITAISKATKQALVAYEYLPEGRIDVVYNGIEGLCSSPGSVAALKRELGIPLGAPVVGSIARFDPIKNHTMMLKAFHEVLTSVPDCRLLLVGDGEERSRIEALIDQLGIRERVTLPGYIEHPVNWLDAMDIFLLSSFSEGTSMTLLEAMSLGKPCVVTSVGGNPEIVIDGNTGRVTQTDDALAFAEAILGLLAPMGIRESMAVNARERFYEEFSSAGMAEHYRRMYT